MPSRHPRNIDIPPLQPIFPDSPRRPGSIKIPLEIPQPSPRLQDHPARIPDPRGGSGLRKDIFVPAGVQLGARSVRQPWAVITAEFGAGAGGVLVPPETGLVAVAVADFDEVVPVVGRRRLLEVFEGDFVDLVRGDGEGENGVDAGELLAV